MLFVWTASTAIFWESITLMGVIKNNLYMPSNWVLLFIMGRPKKFEQNFYLEQNDGEIVTSVDNFAIVHALLDRVGGCARYPDKVCDLAHSLCAPHEEVLKFSLEVYLRSHFEIHNYYKPFSSMSQSQSIGWVKQKPDNSCQTTRIVTKNFAQFFAAHPV